MVTYQRRQRKQRNDAKIGKHSKYANDGHKNTRKNVQIWRHIGTNVVWVVFKRSIYCRVVHLEACNQRMSERLQKWPYPYAEIEMLLF